VDAVVPYERELEIGMRDVLLQLALTSNGRTAAYDNSGGTGEADYVLVDDHGRAKLGRGDAPQLTFAKLWDRADSQVARASALDAARSELAHIRRSHADPTAGESKPDRDARIVKDGAGHPSREVAISIRCGITDVWKARQAVGRDIEWGELPHNGRELTLDERRDEVLRLTSKGLSQREIATRLHLGRGSVQYVLARHKTAA
jgi:hypothetical protein